MTILEDVQIAGQKYYPGIKLYSWYNRDYYNPIKERIMSMPNLIDEFRDCSIKSVKNIEYNPVFFFIYNLDNYYHFLYDTLPHLVNYQHLKKNIPELKLLINFVNIQQTKLNQFVLEFLEFFDIFESDLIFADDETLYKTIHISDSCVRGNLYQELADRVESNKELPKKIYISRRSYKHGQYDNIGTDYTTKRKLINEDILVRFLESKGYTEVFTELLSTKDKIALFKGCTHVIGPIGGGLCNVLFSGLETKLTVIVSPYFLDINTTFCGHAFSFIKTTYFMDTQHVEKSRYKQYMRVKIKPSNIIGEIDKIDPVSDKLSVLYSDHIVAGWNSKTKYNQTWVSQNDVEIIDNGLNSAWMMDMQKFEEMFNEQQ